LRPGVTVVRLGKIEQTVTNANTNTNTSGR
jgi:hypothetical protein